jgi:predicted transcriptional regulator
MLAFATIFNLLFSFSDFIVVKIVNLAELKYISLRRKYLIPKLKPMKLSEVVSLVQADILCGGDKLEQTVRHGFSSDLMSDVLTLSTNDVMLITGLANLQAVRTAEMSDIPVVLFVRDKQISTDIVDLGRDLGLVLLRTSFSMYKTAGILFNAGLQPVF